MPDYTSDLLLHGHQLKKLFDEMLKQLAKVFGLKKNEIGILLFLDNNPEYDTAAQIAELWGIAPSHICTSVEELSRRGFVTGTQDGQDRRYVHLKLEPSAAPIVEAGRRVQQSFLALLYEGISSEEKAVLESVFVRMLKNLRIALDSSLGR